MTNEPAAPVPITDDAAEHLVESYGDGRSSGTDPESPANTPTLTEAVAHLRALRATFNREDEIDEESHLTAAALDVILETLDAISGDVVARDPEDRPTA